MKHIRILLIILMALFIGANVQAQGVISGSNLNIGSCNTLNQNLGNAIGVDHWTGGLHSLVVGNNDTILSTGNSSIALGSNNRIEFPMSMAIGSNIKISNILSVGIGHHLKLQGSAGCMVLGAGITGSSINPSKFLENNYGNSLLIGFNSTKPTLTVGPSPNDYSQGSYDKTGKVGIGDIPVPELAAKLHVRSDTGEDAGMILEPKNPTANRTYIQMHDSTHILQVDNNGSMTLRSKTGINFAPLMLEGRVGVNIVNESEDYAFAVNGGILTDEVMIREVENWYDNVFEDGYDLLSLDELQKYVVKNKHLPDVPSEKEVLESGYKVSEMQGVLLKKIEELTLYVLEQQKRIEYLEQMLIESANK